MEGERQALAYLASARSPVDRCRWGGIEPRKIIVAIHAVLIHTPSSWMEHSPSWEDENRWVSQTFPTFYGRPPPYSQQPANSKAQCNNQLIYCLLTARSFSWPRLLYRNIPCYPPHLKAVSPSCKLRTHHSLVARDRINTIPPSGPPFLAPKFTKIVRNNVKDNRTF